MTSHVEASEGRRPGRRSDARQNHERILEAARGLLQEDGEVAMAAIARRAGVGQGTLYRNFSSREVLVMEVHRADVGELAQAAGHLLENCAPWEALRGWLTQLAEFGRVKRGMTNALQAASLTELATEGSGPILDAIDELLGACRADGRLREDITARDVLLLVGFLWRMAPEEWEERADRLLRVVISGLRAE